MTVSYNQLFNRYSYKTIMSIRYIISISIYMRSILIAILKVYI